MERVTGIGGVFFRAEDPETLSQWYARHLGITGENGAPWWQAEGHTVFAPFPKDTDYFGDARQSWMINFRVTDLDAMIVQLTEAGIPVETRAEWDSEIGRFARLHDPEGNPIELWEPPA